MPLALQLLLVGVVVLSCFLITVAAFQVFHILHEVQLLLKKINQVASNTEALSDASAKPVIAVNQFFAEVKDLVNNTQEEIIQSMPDRVITPTVSESHPVTHRVSAPQQPTPARRFFKRSGQFLRSN